MYLVASTVVAEKLAKLKDQVLGETRKQIKELTKSALNAVQLGAVTLQELNQSWKSGMKQDLNPSYRVLCNLPKQESELLIGEKLSNQIHELNEVNWMGRKLQDGDKSRLFSQGYKCK